MAVSLFDQDPHFYLISFIKKDTTVEQFDALAHDVGPCLYRKVFENFSALSIAADRGNIPLINHIVKIGGRALLTRIDGYGNTPLVSVLMTREITDISHREHAVQTLIDLGAEVDQTTHYGFKKPVTPLYLALSRTVTVGQAYFPIVKLLLRNGATAQEGDQTQDLTPEQEQILAKAQAEIAEESPTSSTSESISDDSLASASLIGEPTASGCVIS